MLGHVHSRILLPPRLRVRERRNQRRHMHNVPEVLQRGVLLPRRRDDSDWRRDGWRLPHRSVQHRGWYNFDDICMHAVPSGDLRLCYYADDCSVLRQLRRGLLLSRRCDVVNWRRHWWRLPDWIIQHRGWYHFNNICLHAVPRGDLRLCYDSNRCGLLGQLRRGVLLPRWLA